MPTPPYAGLKSESHVSRNETRSLDMTLYANEEQLFRLSVK